MIKDYKNLLEATLKAVNLYETKSTKAESARIRKLSLQIGKMGAQFRAYMLKQDKETK